MKNPQFVICIDNSDYPSSLELRKIYVVIKDLEASRDGYLRIIDESGEDYLYSNARFVKVSLPKEVKAAVIQAA